MTPFETTTTCDVAELRARCSGTVAVPGDEVWDQARQGWNLAVDQRPAVVVVPDGVGDVQAAVAFAAANGLRVSAQGTGHNASALSRRGLDGVMLIKLHAMRGVEIDAEARTARVAAGAVWGDLTAPASDLGLAPLAGSALDVGIVGYCLGGGLSWMARKHGMAANSVVAIELVTADGALRRVDAENDPELFWALRGGGGNFGVVTALELRLFEVPELVAGMMLWPMERAAEVAHAWREWTATAPDEATTSMRLMRIPPLPEIPEIVRGRELIVIDGAVLAGEERAGEILAALRALEPEVDTFGPMPPVALSYIHMDPEEPMPAMGDGGLLAELPAEAIDAYLAAAGPGVQTPLLMAEIRHMGGALARVPEGAGAAATIGGQYLLFAGGMAVDPEMARGVEAGVDAFLAAMSPWDSGRMYLNFAERPIDPDRAFGEDVAPRLRAVKAQVDPGDLFRGNHPVTEGR
jgi:FAD/FMN-containing dehydrogenase